MSLDNSHNTITQKTRNYDGLGTNFSLTETVTMFNLH